MKRVWCLFIALAAIILPACGNVKIETDPFVETELTYDVCIVGGGAAGIGAAYALKDSGLKVCLIEKEKSLGGTHTQGYVNSEIWAMCPPFYDEVLQSILDEGNGCLSTGDHEILTFEEYKTTDWRRTHRYSEYRYNVVIDPEAASLKYYEDLSPHIDIYLNTNAETAELCLEDQSKVSNVVTSNGMRVYAEKFIDCSALNILIQKTGGDLLKGGDSRTRYLSEYGFIEEHAAESNYLVCNSPTLMYRISKGYEDLSGVSAAYNNFCAYTLYGTDPDRIYINNFNYITGDEGKLILHEDVDAVYDILKGEQVRHWKKVKNGFLVGKLPDSPDKYMYDGVAPMLGIREYNRAKCERMLHEDDLYVRITTENMSSSSDNLDKKIAIGNYCIDSFGDDKLEAVAKEVSSKMTDYGVPYGCIIPKGYTNLLVASKALGATHLAASSFRLTKHMVQIGWAAGQATKLAFKEGVVDYRNVDVETLQSAEYINLVGMVTELNEKLGTHSHEHL